MNRFDSSDPSRPINGNVASCTLCCPLSIWNTVAVRIDLSLSDEEDRSEKGEERDDEQEFFEFHNFIGFRVRGLGRGIW
jgi:hypothetical protein